MIKTSRLRDRQIVYRRGENALMRYFFKKIDLYRRPDGRIGICVISLVLSYSECTRIEFKL